MIFVRALILSSVFVLGVSVAAVARQDPPPPQAVGQGGEGMPDTPGKDVVVKICGICHPANRTASVRLTRDGWTGVVDDMIKRGAKPTDQEYDTIVDYLATNYLGEAARPLNVNTATAIDLESVAGLLRKEAAAVIEYREKNGPFKALDDMKKVPGLDFKKIDTRRDYLVAM